MHLPPYGFYCTFFVCSASFDYLPEDHWYSSCVEVMSLHRLFCAFCCFVCVESVRQERAFDVLPQVFS